MLNKHKLIFILGKLEWKFFLKYFSKILRTLGIPRNLCGIDNCFCHDALSVPIQVVATEQILIKLTNIDISSRKHKAGNISFNNVNKFRYPGKFPK